MKTWKIQVTQDDIDKSVEQRKNRPYRVCYDCAIARAVSRTLQRKIAWGYTYGSDPDLESPGGNARPVEADRGKVIAFIKAFDDSAYWKAVPFEFELVYSSKGLDEEGR